MDTNKDSTNVDLWLAELIEQKKADAKRWFIAFIIAIAALVCTNAYWIYTFSTYDFISQYSDGINSINTGNQGDVINEPEGND